MKPNKKIFSNLLSVIVTLEDSMLFQEELRLISESVYSGKDLSFDTVMAQQVRRTVALALKEDLKNSTLEPGEFLKQAVELFDHLEVVEMSLGFEPTAEQIAGIAQRVKELAGRPILVSLTYKPYLMGGVEVTFKGEYRDYTLRAKMKQLFVQKSQETSNK